MHFLSVSIDVCKVKIRKKIYSFTVPQYFAYIFLKVTWQSSVPCDRFVYCSNPNTVLIAVKGFECSFYFSLFNLPFNRTPKIFYVYISSPIQIESVLYFTFQ